MASDTNKGAPPQDPFTTFWTDFWQRMTPPGMAQAAPQPSPDMMAQMRKMFFESMADQADRFMRSEQFLAAMKQSMDNALAWQQMLNQFLQKGVSSVQMPTRADADHVVLLVRGMEERVMDKLEEMTRRIEKLERGEKPENGGDGAKKAKSPAREAK